MPIKHGFFNSKNGDRRYDANDITSYLDCIVGNGVFPIPSTNLQVTENSGMVVSVQPGKAWIDGYWLKSNSIFNVTIDKSDVTNNRIDRIVVRLDKDARSVSLAYKKGSPNSSPVAPELIRNADVKEYSLATITVNKQVQSLTQANIRDDRPDDSVCGFVKGLIEQIGTETLLLQYEAMWKEYFTKSTNEFEKWFGDIRDNLSTSTLIRQYQGVYTTTKQDQKVIPIPIAEYVAALDILDVYVNGIMFIEGVHYEKTGEKEITLKLPLDINQDIYFISFKSVDGKDAITVIEQVEQLNTKTSLLKKNVSIPTSAWSKSGDFYTTDISNPQINENCMVNVNFKLSSIEAAQAAEVQGTTETKAGACTIYAKSIPSAELTCDYIIIRGEVLA